MQTRNLLIAIFLFPLLAFAQRNEILSPDIATLQVMTGDDWQSLPIIELGSSEKINISFDQLSHRYHRYTYEISHREADWTPSESLFTSDYLEGITDGLTIDDYQESLNTNQLYTHYSLQIPNDNVSLRMSGNYVLTVRDDDDSEVLRACFMVVEPRMKVGMSYSGNTDVEFERSKQQVSISLNYGGLRVSDPERQIGTVVMQNNRWDNAKWNVEPTTTTSDGMMWTHCRSMIFDGGNEYRKFETLDTNHPTMGIEKTDWDGERFHAYVWTDLPRPNYDYDEGSKGGFLIRNSDDTEVDYTTDYVTTHFALKSPKLTGRVFINGFFTNDSFLPEYEMQWNEASNYYEASLPLKQGYYSYQYLLMLPDGTLHPVPSEGNFYQTRNEYQMLVYYRGDGDRTDRLVAVSKYE